MLGRLCGAGTVVPAENPIRAGQAAFSTTYEVADTTFTPTPIASTLATDSAAVRLDGVAVLGDTWTLFDLVKAIAPFPPSVTTIIFGPFSSQRRAI